jgi:hypothetical protein
MIFIVIYKEKTTSPAMIMLPGANDVYHNSKSKGGVTY